MAKSTIGNIPKDVLARIIEDIKTMSLSSVGVKYDVDRNTIARIKKIYKVESTYKRGRTRNINTGECPCGREQYCKGLCKACYKRQGRRQGSKPSSKARSNKSEAQRERRARQSKLQADEFLQYAEDPSYLVIRTTVSSISKLMDYDSNQLFRILNNLKEDALVVAFDSDVTGTLNIVVSARFDIASVLSELTEHGELLPEE